MTDLEELSSEIAGNYCLKMLDNPHIPDCDMSVFTDEQADMMYRGAKIFKIFLTENLIIQLL